MEIRFGIFSLCIYTVELALLYHAFVYAIEGASFDSCLSVYFTSSSINFMHLQFCLFLDISLGIGML